MFVIARKPGHEVDDRALCLAQVAGLAVGDTKKFKRVVVQPFPNISVMDVADFQLTVGPLEPGRSIGVGNFGGGYFEKGQLAGVILVIVEPHFPTGRFPAFEPGDEKPVTYPIEK